MIIVEGHLCLQMNDEFNVRLLLIPPYKLMIRIAIRICEDLLYTNRFTCHLNIVIYNSILYGQIKHDFTIKYENSFKYIFFSLLILKCTLFKYIHRYCHHQINIPYHKSNNVMVESKNKLLKVY